MLLVGFGIVIIIVGIKSFFWKTHSILEYKYSYFTTLKIYLHFILSPDKKLALRRTYNNYYLKTRDEVQ